MACLLHGMRGTKGLLRKYGWTLLKLAASVALIGHVLYGLDLGASWHMAAGLSAWAGLGLVAAIGLEAGAGLLRWSSVLGGLGAHLDRRRLTAIYLLGIFFNQTLPSPIGGDAIRVWEARRAGLPVGLTTRSVVLERLAGFIALLVLVALATPILWRWSDDGQAAVTFLAVAGGGLAVVGALVAFARIDDEERSRPARALLTLARDTRVLLVDPGKAGPTIGLSFVYQAAQVLAVFALARGIGLEIGLLATFVVVPVVLLAAMLPISLAGWGVREAAMISSMALLGVAAEPAVVVSILFGLAHVGLGLLAGAVALGLGPPSRTDPAVSSLREPRIDTSTPFA